jgi:hypothetical protein
MESKERYRLLGTQLPMEVIHLAIANCWFEPMQGQQQ